MATIDTASETLSVYLDGNLAKEFPYPLPKSCIELSKINLYFIMYLYLNNIFKYTMS